MNQWAMIRRLRGPAYLILTGVLFLLQQWNILSLSKSWPLFLILAGLLRLAERAAWTAELDQQQNQPYASASSWQTSNPYAPAAPAPPVEPLSDRWQPSDTAQHEERR